MATTLSCTDPTPPTCIVGADSMHEVCHCIAVVLLVGISDEQVDVCTSGWWSPTVGPTPRSETASAAPARTTFGASEETAGCNRNGWLAWSMQWDTGLWPTNILVHGIVHVANRIIRITVQRVGRRVKWTSLHWGHPWGVQTTGVFTKYVHLHWAIGYLV